MRLLALIFLLFGVALAGGAVYYAYEHLEKQPEVNVANQGPVTVMVVAARIPLKYGDRLTYESAREVLRFVEWPESAVPENAFRTAAELFGDDKDQTRTVTRAVDPGELVLKSKVTGFGESIRVATQVSEGMRAFTIPINAATGGVGLISPGDRVDIQYVRRIGDQISSHILMQNVLVIATDQVTDTERNRVHAARTATVEVTPEDAQRLTLAQQTGTLSLFLRGTNEAPVNDARLDSVDLSELPGAPPPPTPEAPAPVVVEPEDTGYRVRVNRGTAREEVEFQDGKD